MQDQVLTFGNTFGSFDELCGQLRGVDLELIPLRAGPIWGETKTLVAGDFSFTSGKFVSDHRFRGTTHTDHVLLGMHYGRDSSAYYECVEGMAGDLTLHQPVRENFGSMRGTFEYSALSMEPAELARIAEGVAGGDLLLESSALLRAPAPVAELACAALASLSRAAFRPENFDGKARAELLKRALAYPYLLVAAYGLPEHGDFARETRATIVRRAEAWLDNEPPETVHVVDLCRALGLPLRSVQRAFHETLGIGPAHYLMRYRLHAVRRTLLQCDPAATKVSDVALDHGFWELGRFAGIYRQTYGERPSETLRRRV
ncbi:helix-turn-helix domain-containing protein [Neorhizobium vignae]|uniref:helix-turn-helix domain-containing protein n=1 Tax=Neorhizobium vignae TaxID=690585 RepID=UPI00056B8742|nr:helix-turn-helix domain-containing protein [Neorhizobium vignae]